MSAGPKKIRVAFGDHDRYEQIIRSKLDDRYDAVFADLSTINLDAFDIVAPLHLKHYLQLGAHGRMNGRKFLAPSAEVVEICHDKLALKSFLVANGFEDVAPKLAGEDDGYPFVMKRRRSEWGQDVKIIRNASDFSDLDVVASDWFAEEHLDSHQEYAYHMLVVEGRSIYQMRSCYEMKDEFQIKGRNGKPVKWFYERLHECFETFENIALKLNYTGTLCIDYKVVNNSPKIMEINPRFGGSLVVDINAYLEAYAAALVSDRPENALVAASR